MAWLNGSLAGISINPDDIHFIHTPTDFYSALLDKIRNSKRRIYLSSLYLGTGELESAMLDELAYTLNKNPDLQSRVLFDYLRGTRGGRDSTLGLIASKKLRGLDAYFFHTPDLRGYLKQYLPERVNEIIGLQHMKFYIFDDSIIISGANLSHTYFTNRQDRYVVIENCPRLAEFFIAVFDAVAACSVHLVDKGELRILPAISDLPFHADINKFCANLRLQIDDALEKLHDSLAETTSSNNTMVYPFLQMGPFGIRQEEEFMDRLLKHQTEDINVCFSTGYFNFHDTYADTMLRYSRFPIDVLLASPQANGFFGASGISGYIPALYVYLSMLFYQQVQALGKSIGLYEYNRPGWSFHAKGAWITPLKAPTNWAATVVGSSNYGYRSTFRDLEAQVLIVTTNERLMKRIADEKKYITEHMFKMDMSTFQRPDHLVPVWVRIFAKFFRSFF